MFRYCLLLVCLLFLPLQAQAHKIHVFAWVSGNTITVESNFSRNRPLLNGKVTVLDNTTQTILLQGTGDEQGIFTFPVPPRAKETAIDLLIVVSGGEGHQSSWLIPAAEYLSDSPPAVPDTHPPTSSTGQTTTPSAETALENAELKQMLQKLLEQELAPIRRSLAMAENKPPGFRDIMGGIGYLVGLAGLIAWLRNRPQKPGDNNAQ